MVARRGRNPVVPRRTLLVARNPVVTTVTAHPGVPRRWIYTTLWRHRRQHRFSAAGLTVGLGVQWTPPFRKLSPPGTEPRPGTLQLCAGNRCLVFQIGALSGGGGGAAVPRILRRFLADGRVTFAAYNVASDCRKLRAHHGLEVASPLELRSRGAGDGLGCASMAEMADVLLGIPRGRVEKPGWVATSEWDGKRLSPAQVRYAAADAYLSRRLGDRIRRRNGNHRKCGGGVHHVAVGREEDAYYSDDDGDESVESWDERERELVTLPEPDERDDGRWTYRFVGFIESAAWDALPPLDGGGMELEEDDDDLGGGYRHMSPAPYYQLPYQEPVGVVY